MHTSPERRQYTIRLDSAVAIAGETAAYADGLNMTQYMAKLVLNDVRQRSEEIQAILTERVKMVQELASTEEPA